MSRVVSAPTPDSLRHLAQDIGRLCVGGDVLVLSGDLGAGKTTFTQGLALGLGIDERVTSPTFVISRVHPNPTGGPALVHVDAYRLGSLGELEDLDLDADLASSVVVVEWGRGLAESLSPEGLDVEITRSDDPDDDVRMVTLTSRGERWSRLLSDESGWPA